MTHAVLHYEICPAPAPDGDIFLELVIEQRRIATAGATRAILAALWKHLGLYPQQVHADLHLTLETFLKHQLDRVTILDLREQSPLRYVARYTHRDLDHVSTGLAWYDIASGETGPDKIPTVVRNRLRHEVHRLLTREGTHARAIVDLHR